jgi:Fungal specific transcription factor domain
MSSPISIKNSSTSPLQMSLSTSNMQNNSPNFLDSSLSSVPSLCAGIIPPSRYPIAADTFQSSYQSMYNGSSNGPSLSRSPQIDHSQYPSPVDQFSTYPLHNWSYRQHQALSVPSPSVIPPLSYYYRPHRLEDVAPRETILLILALFFDFVYPLTPCLHKPSFMSDIHSRREERDPLFFALVMSTVASTLIQVPRSYLPMERYAVRKLAQTCHEASRHITVASYDPPTSTHVIIRYL